MTLTKKIPCREGIGSKKKKDMSIDGLCVPIIGRLPDFVMCFLFFVSHRSPHDVSCLFVRIGFNRFGGLAAETLPRPNSPVAFGERPGTSQAQIFFYQIFHLNSGCLLIEKKVKKDAK